MKAFKALFILALLAIAISASAQTTSVRYIFPFYYAVPVECDGVPDLLEGIEGTILVHDVIGTKNNGTIKVHFNLLNDAYSVNTGEKFKVLELSNQSFLGVDDFVTVRYFYNCIGEWGTRIKIKILAEVYVDEDLNIVSIDWIKFETTCK